MRSSSAICIFGVGIFSVVNADPIAFHQLVVVQPASAQLIKLTGYDSTTPNVRLRRNLIHYYSKLYVYVLYYVIFVINS